jgi:peptidoglycan/LPS O-acetylase OafA/YrhL
MLQGAGVNMQNPARGSAALLSAFRFSLALMVMAIHLSGQTPAQTGRAAVEAFFCISGFLITMVASGRYADRPLPFLLNRFLRIYPTYWLCLALAFVVVASFPASTQIHPSLYIPRNAADLAANLGIFGLTQETGSRLLPAAWSLHTELWFYILIGLVTATRPKWTVVLLSVSLVVSALAAAQRIPIDFYGTPVGNADAFLIGSVVWQHQHRLRSVPPWAIALFGFAVFEVLAWMPNATSIATNVFFAAPAAGIFLFGLWNCCFDAHMTAFAPFCNFLGRLSYPIFLLHWPLGALVWNVTGIGQNYAALGITAVLTIGLAAVVVIAFERPLEKLRASVRQRDPQLKPQLAAETAS